MAYTTFYCNENMLLDHWQDYHESNLMLRNLLKRTSLSPIECATIYYERMKNPESVSYDRSHLIQTFSRGRKNNAPILDVHQVVLYQKDLIDAVNDNIRNISLMLLGLAVILTFISFALINNTIRLTIYSKRFLIHTMKLVGASWSFIRRPFLRRNFWIGVLSAVIADAVLWGAAYWLVSYEPELIRVITPDVMLLVSVSVLIFGVLITWLCALLSINKYLKMKAGTLYYI